MDFNLSKPNRKVHAGIILTHGATEMLDIAAFETFVWMDKAGCKVLNLPEEMWVDAIDFELHWVTEDGKTAELRCGTQVQATDSFATCPPLDIALMGASNVAFNITQGEIAYLRKVWDECSAFLTICGGCTALVTAGLLAGKTVAYPSLFIRGMQKHVPDVNWVEKRWSCDGKLWSSGNQLNGLDMMRAFAEATWGGRTGMIEALYDIAGYPKRDVDFKDFVGHNYPADDFPSDFPTGA
ncbi:hypothetical protein EsH8_VI_000001 [Colletotrichum jinshuiense]